MDFGNLTSPGHPLRSPVARADSMTLNSSTTPDRSSVGSSGLGTALSRSAGIGVQFGAVISLFALLGYWLDERMGSSPWLLLLGVLLGFVGGTISLVKAVSRFKQNPNPLEQHQDGEPPPST